MQNEYPVQFVPLDKLTADVVTGIEVATYPEYMHHWHKMDVLDEPLRSAGVERYSFLAKESQWLGYCVAFLENPSPELGEERSLYVCDMVVLPGAQKRGYGTLMAMEVMRRATEDGVARINFSAREKTTYQILLGSKAVDKILDNFGYSLEDQDEVFHYPDDGSEPLERGHLFSLIRNSAQG